MAASQFCAFPGYTALIIRRTYADLSLPEAIMDRAITWWADRPVEGGKIRWHPQLHRMEWPSGAIIQFGHLSASTDHLRYQGTQLHFVGFDEATQIPSMQLTYLHSRLRSAKGSPIPIRYRLATNPGGTSHEFVRDEYVKGANGKDRIYLPALLSENPGLDVPAYRERLARLDPITRKQLEDGDWDVQLSGGFFDVDRIGLFGLTDLPEKARLVRAWDLAATPDAPGKDPDWTVGVLMADVGGEFWILNMQRVRRGPGGVYDLIKQTAQSDGHSVRVVVEKEPGSSGVMVERHLAAEVLKGYEYVARPATGSKYDRAKPFASAVSNRLVKWNEASLNRSEAMAELRAFSEDDKAYAHDDVVDALSMAHSELSRPKLGPVIVGRT